MKHWKIIGDKSNKYILEVEDPDGWRDAQVRSDGCVHYFRYHNTPKGLDTKNDREMSDYLHICDIDDEIACLQELKHIAQTYFESGGESGIVEGVGERTPRSSLVFSCPRFTRGKPMGLNISLYRVIDRDVHKISEDPRFDFIRYAGDVEFSIYTSGTWEFLYCPNGPYCCADAYRRPVDFEQTRRWIKENIREENQKRLLDVVDLMERESDLWLYFGW